jgi:hypothetical protein
MVALTGMSASMTDCMARGFSQLRQGEQRHEG